MGTTTTRPTTTTTIIEAQTYYYSNVVVVAALWAELDVKGKALLRVWNEAFGAGGYKQKKKDWTEPHPSSLKLSAFCWWQLLYLVSGVVAG